MRADFIRKTTVIRLLGAGDEGLGEDVTYDGGLQDAQQARGATLPLARRVDDRQLLAAPRGGGALPRGSRPARIPRLPALGVRERRARPRAPSGRTLARRRRRAEGATRDVRRLGRARRTADDRPPPCVPRPLPHAAVQARRSSGLDRRRLCRAPRAGMRRLDRPQGPVHRDGRRQPARSGAVPAGRRRVPRRLDRGPGADGRDDPDPRAARRADHVGCAHPRRRGHRGAPLAAADGQREAVPLRLDRTPLRGVRLLRGPGDRRVRRRPVGALRRTGADPAARRALPPGHAERRRPGRLQRTGAVAADCRSARWRSRGRETGFLAPG